MLTAHQEFGLNSMLAQPKFPSGSEQLIPVDRGCQPRARIAIQHRQLGCIFAVPSVAGIAARRAMAGQPVRLPRFACTRTRRCGFSTVRWVTLPPR